MLELAAVAALAGASLAQAAALIVNVVNAESQIIEANIGCVTASGRVATGNCGDFAVVDGKLKAGSTLCSIQDSTEPANPSSPGSARDNALTCKASYTDLPNDLFYILNNRLCTGNLNCNFDLAARPTSQNDQAILFRYWGPAAAKGTKVALTFE